MLRHVLLSALLLAAPVAAQSIESVNGVAVPLADPGDIVNVSIGTVLNIHGSGFTGPTGLGKSAKVWTNSVDEPKKRGLKILSFSDTDIVAFIKSGVTGDYDLTVQPKGKDVAALVAEAIVRVVPPVFDAPNPGTASPGALVTLTGYLGDETFGHKPGKVMVGGKKCVITTWTPASIVFEMPEKLADGIYMVEVKNKIDTSTVQGSVPGAPWCLQMDGSAFDAGGPDRFLVKLNAKKYSITSSFLNLLAFYTTDPAPTVSINVTLASGPPIRSLNMSFPLDLETATYPLIIHGSADGKIDLADIEDIFDAGADWSTSFEGEGANDWIVVLHDYSMNEEAGGMQLHGTFSGTLVRVNPEESPEVYKATLGDFRVVVEAGE